ncbi:GNAT family N-acetyltransferase [Paenibacillus polymyxa]|uniref:GNAT family N-acetyltransferase n=1 Tax=Paenibacillus polymyxa TaxID=1406 RepID=UPI0039BF7CFF
MSITVDVILDAIKNMEVEYTKTFEFQLINLHMIGKIENRREYFEEYIKEISNDVMTPVIPPTDLKEELVTLKGDEIFTIALADIYGKYCGVAVAYRMDFDTLVLHTLYVREDVQNNNIGTFLVALMILIARFENMSNILLQTLLSYQNVKHLYIEKCGFEIKGMLPEESGLEPFMVLSKGL